MILLCLNWTTIFENSISGLIVGGLLGLLGFIIWKKQHNYTKKLEVYTDFLVKLTKFGGILIHSIESSLSDELKMEYMDYVSDDFLTSAQKFALYFKPTYIKEVQRFTIIFYQLIEDKSKVDVDTISKQIILFIQEITAKAPLK